MTYRLIKSGFYAASLTFYSLCSNAQADSLWTRNYGGPADEAVGLSLMNNLGMPGLNMDVTTHGIFITASSQSSGGQVPGNSGSEDVWVVKLSHAGDTLWSRVFGGSDVDRPFSVLALSDGGCTVTGRTQSNNGFFTGNNGGNDGFVIRLDANGNVLWKKLYGGSEMDYLYDVIWTSDNHLLVCGETGSDDGDLTGTGSGLSWVMKLNPADGNVVWSKTYTGPNGNLSNSLENFHRIIELSNGTGFIAAGYTTPDFADPNADDIYIHKLDTGGQSVWHTKVGSTNGGEGLGAIIDAGNGAFYVAGRLAGGSGPDVTDGYFGGNGDVWLLKFNASGTKAWDRKFGGTDWDFAYDLAKDTLGYLYLAGFTRSTNNDASAAGFGLQDFWLIKTDSSGNMIWNKKMGGAANDVLHAVKIHHHRIHVMGRTNSSDGWIHQSWGGRDIWMAVLLQTDGLQISDEEATELNVFPNPAGEFFNVVTKEPIRYIELYSINGSIMYQTTQSFCPVNHLPAGVYVLKAVLNNEKIIFRKVTVVR